MRIIELGAGRTDLRALPYSQFSGKTTGLSVGFPNPVETSHSSTGFLGGDRAPSGGWLTKETVKGLSHTRHGAKLQVAMGVTGLGPGCQGSAKWSFIQHPLFLWLYLVKRNHSPCSTLSGGMVGRKRRDSIDLQM